MGGSFQLFLFPDRDLLEGHSPSECQGSLDQLRDLAERHLWVRDGLRAQGPSQEVVPEQAAVDETTAGVSRNSASKPSGWD